MTPTSRRRLSRRLLAALLTGTGVAHVVAPAPFEQLIPDWLPGPARLWNDVATAAELGSAALLVPDRTARAGGVAAVVTLAGVWVANIEAARHGGYRALPGWLGTATAAWVRVPLQLPLLWWAGTITRRAPHDPEDT